jgi:serine/threonine-protein kinase
VENETMIARPIPTQSQPECNPAKLKLLLSDQLNELEVQQLTQHLDSCATCRALLDLSTESDQEWIDTKPSIRIGLSGEFELTSSHTTQHPNATGKAQAYGNDKSHIDKSAKGNASLTSWLAACSEKESVDGFVGRLDRYLIRRVVGTGGMGVVLEGWDQQLHRPVAIKAMHPHLASIAIARQRFVREARAAAAIVHPNVVAIHSVHADFDPPYLVMPLIAGESLQARIDREGQLPVDAALRIASQVADGLAAAHAQGLVHRDVKPANILVEFGTERAMITDFGVVRALDDATMTTSGAIAGTPEYMSPEQARGASLDHRSDLFSLGSVLYTMLVGRSPFRADSPLGVLRRIAEDTPRPIQESNAQVPSWMVAMVQSLLEKRADDRADSSLQVADELRACLSHWHDPAKHPLPGSITIRLKRSAVQYWLPWAVCAVASVLAIVGIVVLPNAWKGHVNESGKLSQQTSSSALSKTVESIPALVPSATETTDEIDLASTFLQLDTELLLIEMQIRNIERSFAEPLGTGPFEYPSLP